MTTAPAQTEPLKEEDVLTEGPAYATAPKKTRVKWYRCKVPREELSQLNKRSNFLGFAQTLGFLGILAAGSGAAIYSSLYWPWYITAALVFINGHFWHFLLNGFHELVHYSVFKQRWLNRFFLRVFSFLGWHNHHFFWASHTEHHKYTLHPPDDQEIVLPVKFDLEGIWKWGFINPKYPYDTLKEKIIRAAGHIGEDEEWLNMLFPKSDPKRRKEYFRWERIVLVGHLTIAGVSLWFGLWVVPLVITFPMIFGYWLEFFCNKTQHIGLVDNVSDFRLCCRTIYLNPFFQFLYWHMNYHIEHHMYAAVPCYRLGKLHRLIKHELPHCPNGLYETWKQIAEIQRRQEEDPSYQFCPELPKQD